MDPIKDNTKIQMSSGSDLESDEDNLGSVEEIMESGGRKKRTISTEAMYWKKWTDFLMSKGQVIKLLRTFSKKK